MTSSNVYTDIACFAVLRQCDLYIVISEGDISHGSGSNDRGGGSAVSIQAPCTSRSYYDDPDHNATSSSLVEEEALGWPGTVVVSLSSFFTDAVTTGELMSTQLVTVEKGSTATDSEVYGCSGYVVWNDGDNVTHKSANDTNRTCLHIPLWASISSGVMATQAIQALVGMQYNATFDCVTVATDARINEPHINEEAP